MKLYFTPGACSLATHIVLRECGLKFDLERVDLKTHQTAAGADYYQVNSKGSVPLLVTDQGWNLTEGTVICQYIADTAGNTQLMPTAGTQARYRVMEWQNYIATDVHKSYSPLFNPTADAATLALFHATLRRKYEWVNARLVAGGPYLTGDTFTAADAYLFVVTRWAKPKNVDLSGLDAVSAFMERVDARASVKAALEAEAAASAKS